MATLINRFVQDIIHLTQSDVLRVIIDRLPSPPFFFSFSEPTPFRGDGLRVTFSRDRPDTEASESSPTKDLND